MMSLHMHDAFLQGRFKASVMQWAQPHQGLFQGVTLILPHASSHLTRMWSLASGRLAALLGCWPGEQDGDTPLLCQGPCRKIVKL